MVTAARNQKKVGYQALSTVPTSLVDINTAQGTLDVANGGTGTTTSTGSGSVVLQTSPTLVTPTLNNATVTTNLTVTGGANVVLDATTGTKIGSSTAQKLSLWNATPNIQPTNAIAAAAFVANTSGIVDDTATFGGYTIGQIVAALKRIGALS